MKDNADAVAAFRLQRKRGTVWIERPSPFHVMRNDDRRTAPGKRVKTVRPVAGRFAGRLLRKLAPATFSPHFSP